MSIVVSRKGKAYIVNLSRAEKDIEKIDISTDKLLLYVTSQIAYTQGLDRHTSNPFKEPFQFSASLVRKQRVTCGAIRLWQIGAKVRSRTSFPGLAVVRGSYFEGPKSASLDLKLESE